MTSQDYCLVMTRVGIAELKANLSRYLRKVRSGRSITVLDRDTPVAMLSPISQEGELDVRHATRRPRDVPAAPDGPPTDSLALLLEDRARR